MAWSSSAYSLTLQTGPAVAVVNLGIQMTQQPSLLNQPNQGILGPQPGFWGFSIPQQPQILGLPPMSQIPPGWAYYPGKGWVQYQWTPALVPQPMPFQHLWPFQPPVIALQQAPVQPQPPLQPQAIIPQQAPAQQQILAGPSSAAAARPATCLRSAAGPTSCPPSTVPSDI